MKNVIFLFLITILLSCNSTINKTGNTVQKSEETITISGRVTDFDGKPIDSCLVQLLYSGFKSAKEVYSDKDGYYNMPDVEKGKYLGIYAIRLKEYPRQNKVAEDDMRLEFWAWNVIADRDLTINPRYQRLELYATNAFQIQRTGGGFVIYTRPMSLGKMLAYPKELVLDKAAGEKVMDISIKPEFIEAEVYADDVKLKINSIQAVEEYAGIEDMPMTGYIIQVDSPETSHNKPYIIFRVVVTNKEYNEKGENVYFYELSNYKIVNNK